MVICNLNLTASMTGQNVRLHVHKVVQKKNAKSFKYNTDCAGLSFEIYLSRLIATKL